MVTALGIDVQPAFTLVFAIGGVAAALAGVLSGIYFGGIDPAQGTALLIFAFIVVVIGGLGSLTGSAAAAVVVGLLQQFANYYASAGVGDISVVMLLALVLLVRPSGLSGKRRRRRIEDAPASACAIPVGLLVLLAFVPPISVDIPHRLQRAARQPRHAAVARPDAWSSAASP